MSFHHWKFIFETHFQMSNVYVLPSQHEYLYYFRERQIVLTESYFQDLGNFFKWDQDEIEMYLDISAMCIYKILKKHPILQNHHSYPVLWIFSFCLLHKYYQDQPYNNSILAQVLKLENTTFNRMEKYFYYLIQYTFPFQYDSKHPYWTCL